MEVPPLVSSREQEAQADRVRLRSANALVSAVPRLHSGRLLWLFAAAVHQGSRVAWDARPWTSGLWLPTLTL